MKYDNDAFKQKVHEWTTEDGCPSFAIWEIRESNQDSNNVIISAQQKNIYEDGPHKFNISIHCSCETEKKIDSIRLTVLAINYRIIAHMEKDIQ